MAKRQKIKRGIHRNNHCLKGSQKKLIVLVVSLILLLAPKGTLLSRGPENARLKDSKASVRPEVENIRSFDILSTPSLASVSNLPLHVDGNAQLASLSSGGNGTATNPYIIENLTISNATVTPITIANSNAYAIIRNCSIGNASYANIPGISLVNCSRIEITNNTISNRRYGVLLSGSSQNTVDANNCSDNYRGICLERASEENLISNNKLLSNYKNIFCNGSDNNKIMENECADAVLDGIYLKNSNLCKVQDNICKNNAFGIGMRGGNSNAFIGNTLENNYYSGLAIYDSAGNNTLRQNIYADSFFMHIEDAGTGNQIKNNSILAGGLSISNTESSIITGNHFDRGICYLSNSSSNTIKENFFSEKSAGLSLYQSDRNSISRNEFLNTEGGISLSQSDRNRIFFNTVPQFDLEQSDSIIFFNLGNPSSLDRMLSMTLLTFLFIAIVIVVHYLRFFDFWKKHTAQVYSSWGIANALAVVVWLVFLNVYVSRIIWVGIASLITLGVISIGKKIIEKKSKKGIGD